VPGLFDSPYRLIYGPPVLSHSLGRGGTVSPVILQWQMGPAVRGMQRQNLERSREHCRGMVGFLPRRGDALRVGIGGYPWGITQMGRRVALLIA